MSVGMQGQMDVAEQAGFRYVGYVKAKEGYGK